MGESRLSGEHNHYFAWRSGSRLRYLAPLGLYSSTPLGSMTLAKPLRTPRRVSNNLAQASFAKGGCVSFFDLARLLFFDLRSVFLRFSGNHCGFVEPHAPRCIGKKAGQCLAAPQYFAGPFSFPSVRANPVPERRHVLRARAAPFGQRCEAISQRKQGRFVLGGKAAVYTPKALNIVVQRKRRNRATLGF